MCDDRRGQGSNLPTQEAILRIDYAEIVGNELPVEIDDLDFTGFWEAPAAGNGLIQRSLKWTFTPDMV
jgi:hypothetical protein